MSEIAALKLTQKELEQLCWYALGLDSFQVAELMGTSVSTVRNRDYYARDKIGARTNAEAVFIARYFIEAELLNRPNHWAQADDLPAKRRGGVARRE